MAFLKWSQKYEIGIPEMDKQLRHCAELLDSLCTTLSEQHMKLHIVSVLYEAVEYANYHFAEEEILMQNIGYPALSEQKKLHAEMSKKFEDFRVRIVRDEPVVPEQLAAEMKKWFKKYILAEDKKFAEIYKQKNKTA